MNQEQFRGIKSNPKAGKSQKGQSLFTRQKPSVTFLEEIAEPYIPKLYSTNNPSSGIKETFSRLWFQFLKVLSHNRSLFRIFRRLGSQFGVKGNANFQKEVFEHFLEYKKGIANNDLKKLNKVCTSRVLTQLKRDSRHNSEKYQIELTTNSKPKVVHSFILDVNQNKEIAQVTVKMDLNEKLFSKQDIAGGKQQLNLESDENKVYYVVFEKPLDDFSKQWMIAGFVDPAKKYIEPTTKEIMYGGSAQKLTNANEI
ncbi:predicted protein [Naegleria gruberi]|uniref:Predicted protein n=1 Tax=Naegleria gruberi TaxID=5762 RepID=D2UXF1_NAEGR|nr:uncharacterized protein NAEGRDRAFT_61100 [Naegleria gruberi]EFC50274.1 predicted protein [Naegleria gruberi]|eukprot:XP_002683018.1 predicted protein [Naegleria gruberi strain NEG-M]